MMDRLTEKPDNEVIRFIDRFYSNVGNDPIRQETLRYQFRAGYYYGEADYLIPERFLGAAIYDFLHTDKVFCATQEDIDEIIQKYLESIDKTK